ncbi:hypothetical protein C8Q75DRAFT_738350 [Abortiporus biennis]|nr:hypothetical protein C8Q75DRAFT_738350 [Abortiporus biennis]
MARRVLPAEIADMIVDNFHDDKRTLFSCSLTCKKWVHRSQFHLFKIVTILLNATDNNLADEFIDVLSMQFLHPLHHIQYLRLISTESSSMRWEIKLSLTHLCKLSVHLPLMMKLEIINVGLDFTGYDWTKSNSSGFPCTWRPFNKVRDLLLDQVFIDCQHAPAMKFLLPITLLFPSLYSISMGMDLRLRLFRLNYTVGDEDLAPVRHKIAIARVREISTDASLLLQMLFCHYPSTQGTCPLRSVELGGCSLASLASTKSLIQNPIVAPNLTEISIRLFHMVSVFLEAMPSESINLSRCCSVETLRLTLFLSDINQLLNYINHYIIHPKSLS